MILRVCKNLVLILRPCPQKCQLGFGLHFLCSGMQIRSCSGHSGGIRLCGWVNAQTRKVTNKNFLGFGPPPNTAMHDAGARSSTKDKARVRIPRVGKECAAWDLLIHYTSITSFFYVPCLFSRESITTGHIDSIPGDFSKWRMIILLCTPFIFWPRGGGGGWLRNQETAMGSSTTHVISIEYG